MQSLQELEKWLEIAVAEQEGAFSLEELSSLYATGYGFYEAGRYEEAVQLFTQLVRKAPLEGKYWRALAGAQQMRTNYQEALQAWALTALLQPEDPTPHFHAGECLLSLGEKKEALKAWVKAQNMSPLDNHILQGLQAQIELLEETL